MARLCVMLVALVMVSCGGGERKTTASGSERQTHSTAQAKRALDLFEAELVENNGLRVADVRIDPDSMYATFSLSDEAVKVWRETEKLLGRPPILAWATVSARLYHGGELVGTHSLRLGQVRQLSPERPVLTVAIARAPARAGAQVRATIPEEAEAQCTVLAVRVH